MKFKDIEQKMQNIGAAFSTRLNFFHLLVLACYADDYSQKEAIVIDDQIKGVNAAEIRNYGIFSAEATYSSAIYERDYIMFIDRQEDVKDIEAFEAFSNAYSEKYLPAGAYPSIYALKFEIKDYSVVQACEAVIRKKYPKMVSLYSFSALRKAHLMKDRLSAKYSMVGNNYNIFEFSNEIFEKKIIDFMTDSQYQDENSIMLFYDRLNNLARTDLARKTLILNDCVVSDETLSDYLALALAYLTFYYKIPVLSDDLIIEKYKTVLHQFHCSYDAYPLYDRITFFRTYPKLCYSYQSMLDFLVYIPPEWRKLRARVEYLKDGKITLNEVDLYTTVIYPSVDEESFERDLTALEKKCHEQKFLHVGNAVYMDVEGEKRLVHCVELQPYFSSIIYACDKTLPPFYCPLKLNKLTGMLPCGAIRFHKNANGGSLLHDFVKILNRLAAQKTIEKPSFTNGMDMYLPEYAKSGLGPIITEFTKIRGNQFKFQNIDKRMMELYGYYSIQMRKEVVDSIIKEVPLRNLRKAGNYLTIWGANSSLTLCNRLFRTVKEE